MTGIAAASFFSNTCRFGGCGLHFPTLVELIEHIEDNHIDTDPRVLEKQELQQPTYVALSYINRYGDCFKLLANVLIQQIEGEKQFSSLFKRKSILIQKGCAFLSAVSPELSLHSALSDSRGSRKEKNLPLQGNLQISL